MCARWREWAFRSGDEGEVGPRPVHVRLEGVSTFGQRMEGESFVTRESDSVPPRWMENFRLGDGPSGLCGLAGIRVSIEKEDGSSIGAEVVPLEGLCERMKEEGVVQHVVNIRLQEQKRCVGTAERWNVDAIALIEASGRRCDGYRSKWWKW